MEDLEVEAAKGAIEEELTEAPEDALIDAATQIAIGALSGDKVQNSSLMSLLPEEAKETLNSLDAEEISEYAVIIERIVTNPDFQALMKYDEVKDLVVTLTNNALNMAEEEPEMTNKILETMGVNRNVILVFFELLDARSQNQETTAAIRQFLLSENGSRFIDTVLDNLSQETVDKLMETFKSQLPALQELYTQAEEAASEIPAGLLTEATDTSVQTEAAETSTEAG